MEDMAVKRTTDLEIRVCSHNRPKRQGDGNCENKDKRHGGKVQKIT